MDFYYELLLITIPHKAIGVQIDKSIRGIFSKVVLFEDWGVKKFAYPIKKKNEGIYLLYCLKTNNSSLEKFRYEAKVNPNILRFLLLNLHKHTKDPKKYIENKIKMKLTEEEIANELAYREKLLKYRKKRYLVANSNTNNITNTDINKEK